MNPLAWAWGAWVRRCARPLDARWLALVRILASTCVVLDLLRVAALGLVDPLFHLADQGGVAAEPDRSLWLLAHLGPEAGVGAFWITVVAFTLVGLGLLTRPAMALGLVTWAQLGHLYTPGDRGVDRILRTVFLILLLSGSHRRWALGLRLRPGARRDLVPSWPADLIRWLLVLVYLSAGTSKLLQTDDWLAAPAFPVVYRIMADPMAGQVDPQAALQAWPLWVAMGWATIALELASPLLLTRWAPLWSIGALPMHLGIALAMDLGMFSWGMLSLQVLVLGPWLKGRWDRRRGRRPGPPDPAPRPPAASSPPGPGP